MLPVSAAINVKLAQLDSHLVTQYASSVRAINILKVISVSHVAMSATNAVLVQTNALNVQLHQNYLQDSVFVKIVSTKIRAFAKLVDLLVPPVWMVTNVKHAPAGSSLVTLYASPVHSINTSLEMNVLCVARAAPSAKPVPVIAFNVQRTLSLSLELALAVIHSFSTKTVRCARRVRLPVLHAMI